MSSTNNAIMEAGGKDRPSMLALGNYVQWKSRIKRYINTKPNHELIHYCLKNPPYKYTCADKTVSVTEGSSKTTTERYMENYKNVSQDIRDQLNAEAEAVQIILIGIDNDIYSTVDACLNACKMWKAIERLKQGKSINIQDLETNLYWEFRKFTSRDGESLESYYSRFYKMMNELVRNQCDVTNHQSQELKTVSYHKSYDILKQHQNEVNEIRAERLARTANPLALVAQQQQVYHPQNHPTYYTQNSSAKSQQAATRNRGKTIVNSPTPIYDQEPSMVAEDDGMNRGKAIVNSPTPIYDQEPSMVAEDDGIGTGYENQRIGNVVGARETVEVTPDAADNSGPMFNSEPLQKVPNNDHYNVFAIQSEHPKQSKSVHDTYPIEQDEHNVSIDSLDMSYDREHIDQNDDDDMLKRKALILKNHLHHVGTPMATKHLDAHLSGTLVDQTKYRSLVGALMYLTTSRLDIVHATCYCARYQAKPTEKHLTAVKRIFRYLKGTINMGLWYPKDTGFELTTFSDSDHAGCLDSRKSTSGGIQFLGGDKLVSWSSKKQDHTLISSAEAEYVDFICFLFCRKKLIHGHRDVYVEREPNLKSHWFSRSENEVNNSGGQEASALVLWMRTQLTDYGFYFEKIPMYCDLKAAIAISYNPVQHSYTKHIDVRYQFIKEKVEKGIVELFFVGPEYQLADLFTKALPEDRFKYLVRRLGMRCLTLEELEVLANESA
nr:hypothetical protein [Tanacetum cinerariifolium]